MELNDTFTPRPVSLATSPRRADDEVLLPEETPDLFRLVYKQHQISPSFSAIPTSKSLSEVSNSHAFCRRRRRCIMKNISKSTDSAFNLLGVGPLALLSIAALVVSDRSFVSVNTRSSAGENRVRMEQIHLQYHCAGRRIPKGCVAVTVGQAAEQQRFVIPVVYLNHPLFAKLLKKAEEEYEFNQKGAINIPCHVEEFRYVGGLIDREIASNHHHHQFLCFKAH